MQIEEVVFPKEPFTRSLYRYQIKSPLSVVLVVEIGGKVIGSCIAFIKHLRNKKTKGRIYSIAVLEGYRKHGIGNQILLEAEKLLKKMGAEWITLEVTVTHTEVVEFYKNHGYKIFKTLEEYYEGQDSYRMRKDVLI